MRLENRTLSVTRCSRKPSPGPCYTHFSGQVWSGSLTLEGYWVGHEAVKSHASPLSLAGGKQSPRRLWEFRLSLRRRLQRTEEKQGSLPGTCTEAWAICCWSAQRISPPRTAGKQMLRLPLGWITAYRTEISQVKGGVVGYCLPSTPIEYGLSLREGKSWILTWGLHRGTDVLLVLWAVNPQCQQRQWERDGWLGPVPGMWVDHGKRENEKK